MIITDLGQRQKSAQNAENITDLPETLQVPSLCCFHNLEPQIKGLVDAVRFFIKKDQRQFLCSKIPKISIVIKNVIWYEKNLMHKAVRPSNYFFQFFLI